MEYLFVNNVKNTRGSSGPESCVQRGIFVEYFTVSWTYWNRLTGNFPIMAPYWLFS